MARVLLKDLLNELISDLFGKEDRGIMTDEEWKDMDEANSPENIKKKIK